MRTTINIEDQLFDKAAKLTDIKEDASLIRLGLEAFIEKKSASSSVI